LSLSLSPPLSLDQTLSDETSRDLYNRFGPTGVEKNPRDDEMRLIINMIASYLSWFIALVIVTIPKSSHSSRFWSSISLLLVITLHALFHFSEFVITSLPIQTLFPFSTLTEFECVKYLQMAIPVVFLLFRLMSEWRYVDVESETIRFLTTVSQNHQVSLSLSFTHPSLSFSSSRSSSSTLFSKSPSNSLFTN
jgi:hypothetical protein